MPEIRQVFNVVFTFAFRQVFLLNFSNSLIRGSSVNDGKTTVGAVYAHSVEDCLARGEFPDRVDFVGICDTVAGAGV